MASTLATRLGERECRGRRTGGLVRVGLGTFPVIRACLDITKTSREHFGKIQKIMIVESQMSIFGVMSLLRISKNI